MLSGFNLGLSPRIGSRIIYGDKSEDKRRPGCRKENQAARSPQIVTPKVPLSAHSSCWNRITARSKNGSTSTMS